MSYTEQVVGNQSMEAMLAQLNISDEVELGRGITVFDIMRAKNVSHSAAAREVRKMVAANKWHEIGVRRTGKGGSPTKVYESVL